MDATEAWECITAQLANGEAPDVEEPFARAFAVVGGVWFYRRAGDVDRRWMREHFLRAAARLMGASPGPRPAGGPLRREAAEAPRPASESRSQLRLVEQARAAAQDAPDDDEDTRW
jgi:hypothetical protein